MCLTFKNKYFWPKALLSAVVQEGMTSIDSLSGRALSLEQCPSLTVSVEQTSY